MRFIFNEFNCQQYVVFPYNMVTYSFFNNYNIFNLGDCFIIKPGAPTCATGCDKSNGSDSPK
jgi:hypothetical protein